MILRHIIGLAIALVLTWMLFFGANYFRVVWTHYFSDEPPKNTGEVSVKIIKTPQPYIGLFCPGYQPGGKCPDKPNGTAPKPHE